jgi:segregation and condensation protein B
LKNELEIQERGGEAEEAAAPEEAEGGDAAADCDGAAQLDAGGELEAGDSAEAAAIGAEVVNADDLVTERAYVDSDRNELKAVIEAVIYITDEPLTPQQVAAALNRPLDIVKELLDELTADYARPERGLNIREIAGGFKMATKPEHHEAVRAFVKALKPPLKLSLAALETLAVIAYKQPVTGPEIMEIRGVQGLGVLKTLIDRKLIATAGRKNVVGKPILYKTTKDFLVQFGLKDVSELPTLKEFEELGRLALSEGEEALTPAEATPAEGEAIPTEAAEALSAEPEESAAEPEESPAESERSGEPNA